MTDCNVMLGKLNPDHLPAAFGPESDQPLDAEVVRGKFSARAKTVAQETGEAPRAAEEMAEGFLRIAVDNMANAIKTVMRLNPDARPGDDYMLNSPYNRGTHLPDVTVVTPVFIDGRPAFWRGARGHHADIGGRTPGSARPDSTHIDEEGVLIDNVKLVARGRFLERET